MRELADYSRALRPEEQEILGRLLDSSKKHVGSITYASSLHTWAFMLLSIIIEQEKRIEELEDKMVGG